MKILIAFLLIVFLAFSGYHLSFKRYRLPLVARRFYLTGTEFLFLGFLPGPLFLNLIDKEIYKELKPLSAFLLGWIGLLFGFQFEIVKIRRFPFEFLLAAVLEGIITFPLVFSGVYFICFFIYDSDSYVKILTALVLASTASCTSNAGLAILAPAFVDKKQNIIRFLRYISSIDGLISLVIFVSIFFFTIFNRLCKNLTGHYWFYGG